MDISQIAGSYGIGSGTGISGGSQNPFLELVVSELQNQNPLEPVSNNDFLAQLAQFSTLEQMEALNTNLTQQALFSQFGQASNLVGKDVAYLDGQSAEPQRGRVDSVLIQGSQIYAEIDGAAVPLGQVIRVYASEDPVVTAAGAGPQTGTDPSQQTSAESDVASAERS